MNETWTLTIKKIFLGSNIRPARERFGVRSCNDRHDHLTPFRGTEADRTDINRLQSDYRYQREKSVVEIKRKKDCRFIF